MENKTPHELSKEQMKLAEEYSRYCGEQATFIKKRAEYFTQNRKNYKSDTATDRAYEITEDGQREAIVNLKLKALSKQISAIKEHLTTLANEARGLY